MQTSNNIEIDAPYDQVFALAARVEDWARILPHYRYVKVLRREGSRTWVRMSAWRDFVPVTWTAIQTVSHGTVEHPGTITFRHIRGLVRGMEVRWTFEPRADGKGVTVSIHHDLKKPPFPIRILGRRLIDAVVGRGFIGYIAGKTLRRIKTLAEGTNT